MPHPKRQLICRDSTQLPSTVHARWEGVKGVVWVAGWAVELQTAPRWALHCLSGAVTDSLVWQETGMIVVDKVAEDTAIWESHSEVLHLNRRTTHGHRFLNARLLQKKKKCCNKILTEPYRNLTIIVTSIIFKDWLVLLHAKACVLAVHEASLSSK